MQLNELPDVLRVPEVAEVLGVTERHTYELLRRGDLKGMRIGRLWRIHKPNLLVYIEGHPTG